MLKFIGFYDYTVILTYMSLVSGVIGMVLSAKGLFTAAIVCLMISGFCDAFDGIVARSKMIRTADEIAFGIQIESLCDAVSFGVFPAILCYFMGMNGIVDIAILVFYCLCGVIRLAFFNVLEANRQKSEGGCNKTYRGLPITTSAMILPLVYLTRSFLPEAVFGLVLPVVMLAMGFLFIFDFSMKKPDWTRLLVRAK